MNFDFADESAKLVMLLYGLVAFVAVVGGLLLLLDVVPTQLARRREARIAAAVAAGKPIDPRRRKSREGIFALFFLLPALLMLGIGLIVPAIRTLVLSFKDGDSQNWVGLENYGWMLDRPEVVDILINTAIWVLLVPLLATSVGLIYAVLVDRARLESLAKSLVFLPMAISFVGAGIIWKFVYAFRPEGADQIGLLNQIWVWLGGEPKQWLLNAPLNTLLLIVVMIWIQAGFAMVVLSAAIKAIPADIVEAARIDGVNAWQMFWRITMPSIRPAMIVVVVTISIATLKLFDIVRTMTNGNFNTNVIATEMYNQAFRFGQTGQGSALAVVLFVLVIPIVIYQVRNLRRQREV
ncbi:alpha-glucoside transport system permease protein [Micromonospora nigra]|uniref:Alpha-glucoside transport system permease protein n=1 Tax=Micromonospora nigra TaxID=145857 RepID=A0A1C6RMI2_9ACTN|nr:sugar ABC transporter permease [Micromonospora nigra]SCL18319.1 alpha-glucoside transport system permease protein [Micromonospora nigra]